MADGAYAFSLPAAEEQAHLLLLGEGSGAVIEGNWNGTVLPLEIRKDKVSFDFAKTEEGLSCQVNVQVSGALTGSGGQSLLDGNIRRELGHHKNRFGKYNKKSPGNYRRGCVWYLGGMSAAGAGLGKDRRKLAGFTGFGGL